MSGLPNLTSLEGAMTPQSPMHCPVLPDLSHMLKPLCINLIYPRPSYIKPVSRLKICALTFAAEACPSLRHSEHSPAGAFYTQS